MKSVVHAACPHDCPDACGVLITIQDGRATKIQGDPDHPVTRGFLCAKVAKYLDRVYSPGRVLYPMRRKAGRAERLVGPAGSGRRAMFLPVRRFDRISWDEALDEIAAALSPHRCRIRARGHPSLFLWRHAGRAQWSFHGSPVFSSAGRVATGPHHLFERRRRRAEVGHRHQARHRAGAVCRHSRYIIAWGANIHGNNVHLWPFIEEARRQGAKLVVIDPYRTRTAKCADWYLPINPGTDAALALGLMHVIIGENLYDADYVARYTVGFEELKARAREYPPEKVAALDWYFGRTTFASWRASMRRCAPP